MKPVIHIALLTVAFAVGSACTRSQASVPSNEAPPTEVVAAPDPNLITVENPDRFAITRVAARMERDQLTATGMIAPDVSRTVPVNALTSGRVADVRVRLGDDVKQGQVLLTMTSPDMSQAMSDYQKFQTDEALTKAQLERAQTLYQKGAMAQKDLEVAQDSYDKAKVDTKTAAERIRILGGDPQHMNPMVEIHAPVSGTVIEQNVTGAAGVKSLDNAPNLFTIADLSQVWVVVDVFENNLAQVHVGDRADIELQAYPGRNFSGRVSNISKLLDPTTRSAKVRIELPNAQGNLRPNMFATVHFVSQGGQTRAVVPTRAILRQQDRDWVFVKTGNTQFRRTEVQTGPVDADGNQQILGGIKAGEQVAANASEVR